MPHPPKATNLERIASAIHYAALHFGERPSLDTLAGVAGMTRYHFDRVFHAQVGVPPFRFVQVLALGQGKAWLAEGRSVLDASYALGLSGPSRLHDLFVSLDAVTPGDFKARGRGLDITWGIHPTAFGRCLVGLSARGVCWLAFVEGDAPDAGLDRLAAAWPEAALRHDDVATAAVVRRVFAPPEAATVPRQGAVGAPVPLFVRATNFQTKVWAALLALPAGRVASYGDVAQAIGQPGAVRAVGTACGKNPIAVLIPCHRVVRGTGAIGHYGFGVARKRALLAWEGGQLNVNG